MKPRIAFIVQCLVFLIPVNVYVIGDWMGVGIQWVLFQYHESYLGSTLISFTSEIVYVYSGIIQGRSAIAGILWALAAFLFILSFVVNLLDIQGNTSKYIKKTFLITVIAGLLLLISDFFQYGLSLHTSAGFCIPLGVPAIIFLGIIGYRYTDREEKYTETDRDRYGQETINCRNLTCMNWANFPNNLVILIVISIFIKTILFFSSLYIPYNVVAGDVNLYYGYANRIASGQIPYVDFLLEYPPFFFIPALIAFIPSLLCNNLAVYTFSFMALMYIIDAATLVCVYLIALNFFGPHKAFICGFLYVTAVSAEFYVPITYDIVPVFFLVVSLLLYIYGKTISAYVTLSAGALAKWFPVLAIPLFFIHSLKSRDRLANAKKGIAISVIFFMVFTIPFVFLNWGGFAFTYLFNLSRDIQTHSLVYYGEVISRLFSQNENIGLLALVLLGILEFSLLIWYYQYLDDKMITLCYCVFLSVFFFVVLNKNFSASYIIWLTPFLAIFLVHSYRRILLFYLAEIIIYIETPLLYRVVYGDNRPYYIVENSLPSFSFVFYSVKFAIFFIILWVILRDLKKIQYDNEKLKDN